jgi:cytochrome c oxidase assembly protein subunit 15
VFLSLLTHKLAFQPLVVMSQLMLGLAALGLLWWVVLREQRIFRPAVEASATVLAALRPRAMIALMLVIAQIVLGAWVSVNLSALACPDFPTCRQGIYWPDMDFADGFILWRDLGLDYDGRLLNLSAATAIHMAHRVGAVITLLYTGWLALHTIRIGGQGNLCRYGLLLLAVLLAQTALGVALVVAHLPLVLAVAHHALAALMLVTLITYNHVLRTPGRK